MSFKKDNELAIVAEQSNLSHGKVQELLSQFGDSFNQARALAKESNAIIVTDEKQVELMGRARVARLKLKNIRVEVEHIRKNLKEESLREGKAIDGMANIIKALVVPIEEHLEKQEKFAERAEDERKHQRHVERIEKLSPYVERTDIYSLEDMSDDAFDTLLRQSKDAHKAKQDAERQAEIDRQARVEAEQKEQQRIREENIRLKKEAEERERIAAVERQANEKKLAEERAKAAAVQKAKDEELRIEREKAARLARERAEEQAAKAKAEADAAEKKRQELLAPDKEKLLRFADMIDQIEMPNVANREAGKVLDETKDFLIRISKNLRNKSNEL